MSAVKHGALTHQECVPIEWLDTQAEQIIADIPHPSPTVPCRPPVSDTPSAYLAAVGRIAKSPASVATAPRRSLL